MKKIIIILVLVVVSGTTLWGYHQWDQKKNGGSGYSGGADRPDLEQKMLSFSIDGRSPKGAKQWHLNGTSAEIIGDAIHLKDLKAIAYGDEAVINLTSDSGIYLKDAGEVELIGNVEVVSDEGFVLTTEKAKWSQHTKVISTDDMVNIKGDGMMAKGLGGMANSDKRTAVLLRDVVVEIEPNTTVNCEGPMEIDSNSNIATFYKNVKVVDKDGDLFSDKLTVDFDPSTKKLAMVTAEGNVKVKKGNSYTMSDKAIYTDSTKSAKLLGKPRIVIDPGELDDLDNRREI